MPRQPAPDLLHAHVWPVPAGHSVMFGITTPSASRTTSDRWETPANVMPSLTRVAPSQPHRHRR
jgi:hypothetical protein